MQFTHTHTQTLRVSNQTEAGRTAVGENEFCSLEDQREKEREKKKRERKDEKKEMRISTGRAEDHCLA